MSDDDDTARLPPVDESIRDRFRQEVIERHGGIRGHYRSELENAMKAYIEAGDGGDVHDKLDRLIDLVEGVVEGDSSAGLERERDSISKRRRKKINKIMDDIAAQGEVYGSSRVQESDIEAAIEEHAGHAYKTKRTYKRLLVNQHHLFKIPEAVATSSDEDMYYVEPGAFIAYVEQNFNERDRDYVADYYGYDWWQENAPDGLLDEETLDRGMH